MSRFDSKAAFCRAIGMSPPFLNQILSGERPLPVRFARPVERETGGEVTAAQLFPEIFSTDLASAHASSIGQPGEIAALETKENA
ncbi:MAG: hypothetical protein UMU75_04375 [Halomonas sp.]|nr:hypothetical protein [Halomonas sp.]